MLWVLEVGYFDNLISKYRFAHTNETSREKLPNNHLR